MDLSDYQKAKFELAGVLRAAADAIGRDKAGALPFSDLFARLAEDRFNLTVVGRFSRGKTSLMNAMLKSEHLPTGLVPLTSVITTVAYGTQARVIIEYAERRLPNQIELSELPNYVTQEKNPGNVQGVALARIQLPSNFLRQGFHFVDTPGLGSSIIENTRTTENFLPEADAFILVTSYDSPLSEEEMDILRGLPASARRVFLVINKQDLATLEARSTVLDHVRDQARIVLGNDAFQLFSVSARLAIEANRDGDQVKRTESGLPVLEEALIEFLLQDKQQEFLMNMVDRIASALAPYPECRSLTQSTRDLRKRFGSWRTYDTRISAAGPRGGGSPRFISCEVCGRIERATFDFLRHYQYDLCYSPEVQREVAQGRGTCRYHTWLYETMASPRGTCIGFSEALEHRAARLRQAAHQDEADRSSLVAALEISADQCVLCAVHRDTERQTVEDLAHLLEETAGEAPFSGLCLLHLEHVASALAASPAASRLLERQADMLDRLVEDMRRYVLNCDAARRYLITEEENAAQLRALTIMAGHRNVDGARKRRSE